MLLTVLNASIHDSNFQLPSPPGNLNFLKIGSFSFPSPSGQIVFKCLTQVLDLMINFCYRDPTDISDKASTHFVHILCKTY